MDSVVLSVWDRTKDSIEVGWTVPNGSAVPLQLAYRVVGGAHVHRVAALPPDARSRRVSQLHENSAYQLCVGARNATFRRDGAGNDSLWLGSNCVETSTAADSMHVALGSTFGAFLALALIISCVVLAKFKRERRHGGSDACDERYDQLPADDYRLELSHVARIASTVAGARDLSGGPNSSSRFQAQRNGRRPSDASPLRVQSERCRRKASSSRVVSSSIEVVPPDGDTQCPEVRRMADDTSCSDVTEGRHVANQREPVDVDDVACEYRGARPKTSDSR